MILCVLRLYPYDADVGINSSLAQTNGATDPAVCR